MSNLKLAVISAFAVVAMVVAGGAVNDVQAAAACKVKASTLGTWGDNITVSGNKATGKFTVEGTNCTTPVTFASWERPTAEGINDQILFDHTTQTFGPGEHSLTVDLPECMWQVDIVEGSSPTAADGTANYQYQNGKFVDGGLRDFKKGGTGTCEKEEPCPHDPSMDADDPNCKEVCPLDETMDKDDPNCKVCPYDETMTINDEDCKKPETPVKETPKAEGGPTTLPKTGPAAAFLGIGAIGATLRQLIASRRGLKTALLRR